MTRTKFAVVSALAVLLCVALLILGAPYGIFTRRSLWGAALMLTACHLLFLGLVGFALLFGTGRWKSLVNFRWLSFYGEISYGLYLIHWLVFISYDAFVQHHAARLADFHNNFRILTIRFCCVAALATLIAWLSRKFYEERFLQLKSRFS